MLEDLIEERLKKLARFKKEGLDPFPARVSRTITIEEALESFAKLSKDREKITIAGRIIASRDQGSVLFLDVRDGTGELQAVAKKDTLKNFDVIKELLDRGDFISVGGTLFETKRGEKSIEAQELHVIAKSTRPIPTTFYGLKDKETLLRKRYLDFIAHPELKDIFKKKATFWRAMRSYLEKEGFLEVETPVLEQIPGGAEAEPFTTHYKALKQDVYLRISPELHLKRLLVAGFEKVFEIGRIFRNEGIDAEHLQDYTQIEIYWAYKDYNDMMELLEEMFKKVIKETFGTLEFLHEGRKVDWNKKWQKLDYYELFKGGTGLDLRKTTKKELLEKARELKIETADSKLGKGKIIDLIYKKTIRSNLIKPGFLVNPPVDVEPLAKRTPDDPGRVERFQIVAYGTELGKGFTELNDPIDQQKRFEEQMALRKAGDKEAQMLDEDYLEAMEYGMPPAAGFGTSERLFAVLADKPVRETVFFPLTRSKE